MKFPPISFQNQPLILTTKYYFFMITSSSLNIATFKTIMDFTISNNLIDIYSSEILDIYILTPQLYLFGMKKNENFFKR